MGGFELQEHTADVGIVATGASLSEALCWAAKGMFSVIADMDGVQPRQALEVAVTSTDTDTLAVDWLNELLYQSQAEQVLLKEFEVEVDESGSSLTARCMGEPYNPERHEMPTDVKAATYHGLDVSHNGQWRIYVVLDV